MNKNIYFYFLQDGEMNACQVRKGPNGNLEYFEPKNEECDINLNISFMKKQCIRPFNKGEIKVDEHFPLCENMEENEIVPFLYEEDNDNELDILLNLSLNADISTQCSTNPSIVYTDSDDQFEFNNLNVTFNSEL